MIRRYQWQGGLTDAQLDAQVPTGLTATVKQTSPATIDIELLPDPVDAEAAEDIDEAMTSFGWAFREENPTDDNLITLAEWNAGSAILTANPAPVLTDRNERQVLAYQDSGGVGYAYFASSMDSAYDPSRNLRLKVYWVAATAVELDGDTRWTTTFERLTINGPNVDNTNWATDKAINAAPNAINGRITSTIFGYDNAELGDIKPGNHFRVRVGRQAGATGDTMPGDAQLMRVQLVQ